MCACCNEPTAELSCMLSVAVGWWWSNLTDSQDWSTLAASETRRERGSALRSPLATIISSVHDCVHVSVTVWKIVFVYLLHACVCVCVGVFACVSVDVTECVFVFAGQCAEILITDWGITTWQEDTSSHVGPRKKTFLPGLMLLKLCFFVIDGLFIFCHY